MATTLPIPASTPSIALSKRDVSAPEASGTEFDALLKTEDATLATQAAVLSQAIAAQIVAPPAPAAPVVATKAVAPITPAVTLAVTPSLTTSLHAAIATMSSGANPAQAAPLPAPPSASVTPHDPTNGITPSGAPVPNEPAAPAPLAVPAPPVSSAAPLLQPTAPGAIPGPVVATPPVKTKREPPVQANPGLRRAGKRAPNESPSGDVRRPDEVQPSKLLKSKDETPHPSPTSPSAPPAAGPETGATQDDAAPASPGGANAVTPAAPPSITTSGGAGPDPATPAAPAFAGSDVAPTAAATPVGAAPPSERLQVRSEPAVRIDPAAHADAPARLERLLQDLRGELQTGRNEFRLRLDPAELGRLDVRIVAHGDGVVMHVVTERQDVADWIRTDLPLLHKTAEKDGLHVLGVEIKTSVDLDQRSGGDRGAARDEDRLDDAPLMRRSQHPATAPPRAKAQPGLSQGIDLLV